MSPDQLSEFLSLHPAQQSAYYELIMWGNQGVDKSFSPSTAAIDKALEWAKQVPIPAPVEAPKTDEVEE